jgi:hypothetical protein
MGDESATELGAVIIPSSKREHDATIVMWLDRRRLRQRTIAEPLI